MECYKVKLPEDARLIGTTATGEPAQVYPGEYLVHLLRPKVPVAAPAVLRFVGADVTGRDVHVPIGLRGDPRREASELFARIDAHGHGAAEAVCAA
jgi:hypothetical protein